jgi:hypothetical protein
MDPKILDSAYSELRTRLAFKLNELLLPHWENLAKQCEVSRPEIARINAHAGYQAYDLVMDTYSRTGREGLKFLKQLLIRERLMDAVNAINASSARIMFESDNQAQKCDGGSDSYEVKNKRNYVIACPNCSNENNKRYNTIDKKCAFCTNGLLLACPECRAFTAPANDSNVIKCSKCNTKY